MNLSALKNLTTGELMALANEANNIVEQRLSTGIGGFLKRIAEKECVKETRVNKTEIEGPIVIDLGGDLGAMSFILAEEFTPLRDSGVMPTLLIRTNDSKECPFIMTTKIEIWPDTWTFLQDMDDEFLTAEDALECYNNLHGDKK